MQPEITQLREPWLERGASFLVGYLDTCGFPCPPVRVSCGWPSWGGRTRVIGQCFSPKVCEDGKPQIFISPRIADSFEVLGILLHELLHAAVGCEHGHGKKFSQAAHKVGLVGPPTATTVGDGLKALLEPFIAQIGPYPHAAIKLSARGTVGSRLRLYECECDPPVKVRAASDGLQVLCLVCKGQFLRR